MGYILTYSCKACELDIPSSWVSKYPNIFGFLQSHFCPHTHIFVEVRMAEDETIDEVVLSAKTRDAFMAASSQGSKLEHWLFNQSMIMREGDDIFIHAPILSSASNSSEGYPFHIYHVDVALPCHQGFMKRGATRISVILPEEVDSVTEAELTTPSQGRWQENMEIAESFLVSATFPAPLRMLHHNGKCCRATETDTLSLSPTGSVRSFVLQPLAIPIDEGLDDVSLYIHTSDLRPLGVLNGDWVLSFRPL